MAIQTNITDLFQSPTTNDMDVMADETLNKIFQEAAINRISDVHFEDEEEAGVIRVRQGNKLKVVKDDLTHDLLMVMRGKIFSRCRISETVADSTPVDGRFYLKFPEIGRIDFRVNCTPTAKGFSLVCRLLDQKNAQVSLDTVEMTPDVRRSIYDIINSPSGLFLVTGPTGSGKTTTLYSIINELNNTDLKILTVEHPVEYVVPNLQQIDIDQHTTFAKALRAAMRQDPDVILIGEIRDAETAKIAVEAALTGHLVISTLHSNSALAAIPRLIDMGVDRTLLAQVLKAVAAQRLCRKLKNSRFVDDASDNHKEWLVRNGFKELENKPFGISYDPSKYQGRVPVIEFATITPEMRECIATSNFDRIHELAQNQPQYEPLPKAGVRMALQGLTSLEEVIAISEAQTSDNLSGLRIGERLVRLKYLTQYQVDVVLDIQKNQQKHQRQLFGDICVELNYCKQEHISEALDQ